MALGDPGGTHFRPGPNGPQVALGGDLAGQMVQVALGRTWQDIGDRPESSEMAPKCLGLGTNFECKCFPGSAGGESWNSGGKPWVKEVNFGALLDLLRAPWFSLWDLLRSAQKQPLEASLRRLRRGPWTYQEPARNLSETCQEPTRNIAPTRDLPGTYQESTRNLPGTRKIT